VFQKKNSAALHFWAIQFVSEVKTMGGVGGLSLLESSSVQDVTFEPPRCSAPHFSKGTSMSVSFAKKLFVATDHGFW
jgi:hypothetical protein